MCAAISPNQRDARRHVELARFDCGAFVFVRSVRIVSNRVPFVRVPRLCGRVNGSSKIDTFGTFARLFREDLAAAVLLRHRLRPKQAAPSQPTGTSNECKDGANRHFRPIKASHASRIIVFCAPIFGGREANTKLRNTTRTCCTIFLQYTQTLSSATIMSRHEPLATCAVASSRSCRRLPSGQRSKSTGDEREREMTFLSLPCELRIVCAIFKRLSSAT